MLMDACDDNIMYKKLSDISNHIGGITNAEQYLPDNERIDPQILSMMEFDNKPFSLFCDFGNIPGYAQLGYSFVEPITPVPNNKYCTTSIVNLCKIGNGRTALLTSTSDYCEVIINTVNNRHINGTFFENITQLLDNLADAIVKHVKHNPSGVMDLSGDEINHHEPFPHDDSDNSDIEDNNQKKISSKIEKPYLGHNLVFSHAKDLQCLHVNNRINDNVINSYLFYIIQKYHQENSNDNVIICTNSHVYGAYLSGQMKTWSSPIIWTKEYTNQQLTNAKYIIYPIYHQCHWVWFLVNLNVKDKDKVTIVNYDSLSSTKNKNVTGWKRECSLWILKNVNDLNKSLKNGIELNSNRVGLHQYLTYPQQPDYTNCGIYVLLGIDIFLKGNREKPLFNFSIEEVLLYKKTMREFYKHELVNDYIERLGNKNETEIEFNRSIDNFLDDKWMESLEN